MNIISKILIVAAMTLSGTAFGMFYRPMPMMPIYRPVRPVIIQQPFYTARALYPAYRQIIARRPMPVMRPVYPVMRPAVRRIVMAPAVRPYFFAAAQRGGFGFHVRF